MLDSFASVINVLNSKLKVTTDLSCNGQCIKPSYISDLSMLDIIFFSSFGFLFLFFSDLLLGLSSSFLIDLLEHLWSSRLRDGNP